MPEAEQSADLRDRLRVIMDKYSEEEAGEDTTLDTLMDIDAFASEFGDQLNERLELGWQWESIGGQMEIRNAIKQSLRSSIRIAIKGKEDELGRGSRGPDQWLDWMVDEIRDYFTRESVIQMASVELWGRECEVSDMAEVAIRAALNEVFGPERLV